jgi:hypothetical protein
MKDEWGTAEVGEELLDGVPGAQVVVGFARDHDLLVSQAACAQGRDQVPAQEAGAAGDNDGLVAPVEGSPGWVCGHGMQVLLARVCSLASPVARRRCRIECVDFTTDRALLPNAQGLVLAVMGASGPVQKAVSCA